MRYSISEETGKEMVPEGVDVPKKGSEQTLEEKNKERLEMEAKEIKDREPADNPAATTAEAEAKARKLAEPKSHKKKK